MATETKDPTIKKSEAENPQDTRTLPGQPSTLPVRTLGSSNPSALPSSAPSRVNPQTVSSGSGAATGGVVSKVEGAHSAAERTLSGSTGAGSFTDVEKKLRRAERFGLPFQQSEQEKRISRAERFGSGSRCDPSRSSEELKRKARAERFGLAVFDEEAKKKARLARFGSDTKADVQEDKKRPARAIRFSYVHIVKPFPLFAQPLAGSVSHVNGKGNINMNTTVADKAVGGT